MLGPGLARLFKQLYPAEMTMSAGSADDGCRYDDPEVWSLPSWHLRLQGLYLGPGFSRVQRACEGPEWSALPWSVVNQHPGRLGSDLP